MEHDKYNPSTLNTTVTLSNCNFPEVENLSDFCDDGDDELLEDDDEEFLTAPSSLDRTFDLGRLQGSL